MPEGPPVTERHIEAVHRLAVRATVPLVAEQDTHAEVVGTGTLVQVGTDHLLVTAEHVGRHIGPYELGIPMGSDEGKRCDIVTLGPGIAIHNRAVDVTVYRIANSAVLEQIKRQRHFLTVAEVDLGPHPACGAIYVVFGFPTALSRLHPESFLRSEPLTLATVLYEGQVDEGFRDEPYDPHADLLLAHRRSMLNVTEGQVLAVPDLEGISGSSVWRVNADGIPDPRIVAVQTGYIAGRWIRAKRWWLVMEALHNLKLRTGC